MDWLQGGYYPLRTPEGAENGYICLNVFPTGVEILVAMDRAPESKAGFDGCFTPHLAVKRSGATAHFPSVAAPGKYRARCIMAMDGQTFPEGSVDYTLFQGEKPIAAAILYTAPEPTQEEIQQEIQEEVLSDPAEEVPPVEEPAYFSLKSFDPFNTTNEAYQWWLCQNYDEFQQVMAQTGVIPHPPLFATLQSALIRYGHFIIGRYTEENGGRILWILGGPGMESVLSETGNARWIAAQNKITGVTEYAGYSLHYFDAETGKLIRAIIRQ